MVSDADLSRQLGSLIDGGLGLLARDGRNDWLIGELLRGAEWRLTALSGDGLYDDAISAARRIADVLGGILEADDPVLLRASRLLGEALFVGAHNASAIDALSEALNRRSGFPESGNREDVAARFLLVRARQVASGVRQTVAELEELAAVAHRLLGQDDPLTLRIQNTLAISYRMSGDVAKAIPLHESVLADRERLLGATHPDTIRSRSNLAHGYAAAGRTDGFLATLRRCLSDAEAQLGEHHVETITYRNNLAQAMRTHGDFREAVGLLERVLKEGEELHGPDHPNVFPTRMGLAIAYLRNGRRSEARRLAERSLEADARTGEPVNDQSLIRASVAAGVLFEAGEHRRAKKVLAAASRDARAVLGRRNEFNRGIRAARREMRQARHSGPAVRVQMDTRTVREVGLVGGWLVGSVAVAWTSGNIAWFWWSAGGGGLRLLLFLVTRHMRS